MVSAETRAATVNPKNGPKSCVAAMLVMNNPKMLAWKCSSSTGNPFPDLQPVADRACCEEGHAVDVHFVAGREDRVIGPEPGARRRIEIRSGRVGGHFQSRGNALGHSVTGASRNRGSSHGSSLRRPSAHSLCANALCSLSLRRRNQLGSCSVRATSGGIHSHSDSANRGLSCLWTTSTCAAPASHSNAAHSNALWRPPTIVTRRPAKLAMSTASHA